MKRPKGPSLADIYRRRTDELKKIVSTATITPSPLAVNVHSVMQGLLELATIHIKARDSDRAVAAVNAYNALRGYP